MLGRRGLLVLLTACVHPAAVPSPIVHGPIAFLPSEGCGAARERRLPPVRASDGLTAAGIRGNPPAARAVVAREVPGGYADGPYPSAPGRSIVWLQDTTARAAVLAALAAKGELLGTTPFDPDAVDLRVSEWNAAALYDWQQYIVTRAALALGVNSWSIEGRRVRLGLVEQAAIPRLVTYLEAHHVPCDLVVFEVVGRITLP